MKKSVFLILCLEGAILSFNVAASAALVPSIARDFNVAQFYAGKIIWLYMLPYGVAALFYGPLARVFCAKKIELICLFLFSLANLAAAFSQNIHQLFVSRFFMGVFGASVIPLILILVSRHTAPEKRGSQIGLFFAATFVASLAGLFLSGVMPWRMIYLLPAIAGLILWIFMLIFLPQFKEDPSEIKVNYLAVLADQRVIAIFTYIFVISLLYHGIQQWLGVYFASKYQLNQFLVSMLITLTSLSGIFGEIIGGQMADKLGRAKTVDIGIIIMALATLALIIKMPIALLIIIMIAWGLGWTFNHAGLSTMLTDLPKEFLNEAASLNSGIRFISGGLGTVLAGILMQRSFVLGFSVSGICLLLLLFLVKQKQFPFQSGNCF